MLKPEKEVRLTNTYTALLAHENTVFLGGYGSELICLNPLTETWPKRMMRLGTHRPISSIARVADGDLIASTTFGRKVRIGSTSMDQPVEVFCGGAEVTATTISNDGKLIASGDKAGGVVVWSSYHYEAKCRLVSDSATTTLAFSPNGQMLAQGTRSGKTHLWSVETERCSTVCDQASFEVAQLLMEECEVVIGGDRGHITVFDLSSGRQKLQTQVHRGRITGLLRVSPELLLTCGKDGRIAISRVNDSHLEIVDEVNVEMPVVKAVCTTNCALLIALLATHPQKAVIYKMA